VDRSATIRTRSDIAIRRSSRSEFTGQRLVARSSVVAQRTSIKLNRAGGAGLEAAQRIHEERPVPIIIITAYSDAETVDEAMGVPVFHYLVKPVSAAQLGAAIAVTAARHQEWLAERKESHDLRRRLDDRKIIERAKGILMEREGISENAAYRVLQRTSQSRNMTMADLARSLLAAEDLMRAGPPRPTAGGSRGAAEPGRKL
jgi:response regulator NasT